MDADEIRQMEDVLLQEWRNSAEYAHTKFIAYGVIHPATYVITSPKVLFLAREANWQDEVSYKDMRSYLVEGVDWRNWQVIARWTKALTADHDVVWQDVDDEAKALSFKRDELRKVAFVNIKKQGGRASVDWKELITYAKSYASYILRQIEICKPNVIVCNGTMWMLERFVIPYTMREAPRWTQNDVRWFPLSAWPCVVIDMPHFTARKDHRELYERLVLAWNEIRGGDGKPRILGL